MPKVSMPLHVPYFEDDPYGEGAPVSHLVWERWRTFGEQWGVTRARQKMNSVLALDGTRYGWPPTGIPRSISCRF